jgi:hypothetical protein
MNVAAKLTVLQGLSHQNEHISSVPPSSVMHHFGEKDWDSLLS